MTGFLRLVSNEWIKLQKWLVLILLVVGPIFSVIPSLTMDHSSTAANQLLMAYSTAVLQYAWIFFPILTGVFAALICRYEHISGGWKQLLVQPVSRSQIYLAKAFLLLLFTATSQIFFVSVFLVGTWWYGMGDSISWEIIIRSAVSGWLAVLPLAALQLWISFLWRSFGVPLAINIALALPSILAAQSETFGPYYPWAQPMLAMVPFEGEVLHVSIEAWVIIVGFLIAGIGGWLHFTRRDMEW